MTLPAGARPGLALFDLDHTLLPLDSDHAWGEFVIGLGWVDEAAFRRGNDAFYAQYREGPLDIDAYIAFATAPLRERTAAELAAAHRRFMPDVIEPAIGRPRALIAAHRDAGDRLALVTSTNDFVTAPIAAAFAIDDPDRDPPGARRRRRFHRPHRGHAGLSRGQGRACRTMAG